MDDTTLTKNLLNKKLNKWAGTTDVEYDHPDFGIAYCFEWLVPKLDEVMDLVRFRMCDNPGEKPIVVYWCYSVAIQGEILSSDKNPALALCLAIEKLIDGEK